MVKPEVPLYLQKFSNFAVFTGEEAYDGYPGVKPVKTWQERLSEWNTVLQRESLRETLDTARSQYEVEPNWPEVVAQIEKGTQAEAEAPKSMRAFWVARKWWKHRPRLPYTYLMAKILNGEVLFFINSCLSNRMLF